MSFSYKTEMAKMSASPEGDLFIEAGFTVEHSGGGTFVWQLLDASKPNLMCWVSASENEPPHPRTETAVGTLWTCGRYLLDDNGFMFVDSKDDRYEDVRGVPAAIEWCKQQLAKAES